MTETRRCLPIAQWPSLDRALWERAMAPAGFLVADSVAAGWSARTRDKVARGYGRWLRWLTDAALLDPAAPPGARVDRAHVAAYLDVLSATCSSFTLMNRVHELYNAMRLLAPERDWRWLATLINTLRARARPVSNKRLRLRSPVELIELGQALMDKAERSADWSVQRRAVHFRDGLIIAFLAHRPVRMRNLASMRIGTHLVLVRGRYWVTFGSDETKTGQPYEAPFPDALVPALDRYLDHYRPVLLLGENRATPAVLDALWVSEVGTQLEQGALGRRIVIQTRKAFGQSLPPHWFRDAAATEIAIHNPAFVDDARHLLGHATPRTAERHYNQARSLVASRRYHDLLGRRRENAGRADKADGDDR